jgi:alpha-N-arabinofuranosidase
MTIDAGVTTTPISKYIYGQFIEHLGRCIYGGIWAEMIDDRKFFYAPGAEESPWKTLGGDGALEMVKDGAYVGEHMPRLHSAEGKTAGLTQGGLGLVKGKEYVGRVILAGDAGCTVGVSLAWGDGPQDRQTVSFSSLTADFQKMPLKFTAGADSGDARIEINAQGAGRVDVGTLSLMPADNVKGMRADTLALLHELNAPVYRWPGGNFVSGYNWKDGLGDPDRRPPRKNPAWKGVEHNDFGIDEFMAFCRELNTEPYIVVNSGLGDVESAIEELGYANGAPGTPLGDLRGSNGHADAYGVKWWGIGNEMYGDWQLGHMPIEEYVRKHNMYAKAMRGIDPSIKIIAVGATGDWSKAMLTGCADYMDLLSEHFYCQDKPELVAHVRQIPDAIAAKVRAHKHYLAAIPEVKGKSIPICMDEWNYWYGPDLYGEIGTRYFLRDALGIAEGLHEYYRSADTVFMANYAQTVNVIGCIKTSKTAASFETTGLVLKLYRAEYGTVPVAVEGVPKPLDAAAAWTESRDALTISVVNPTDAARTIPCRINGAELRGDGTLWVITGSDAMAYNEPGKAPGVTIQETPVTGIKDTLEVPRLSICLFKLAAQAR